MKTGFLYLNMKRHHNRPILTLTVLFLLSLQAWTQPNITVPNLTVCPCQTTAVIPTWNNVSGVNYTLIAPGVPTVQTPFTGSIAISNCTNLASTFVYTLVGSGTYTGSPLVRTTNFTLSVIPPTPLSISQQTYYCPGETAVLTASNVSAPSYSIAGPGANFVSPSNVISIPNVTSPSYTGAYTVTAVSGGCTLTGVTNVSVAPNALVNVNTPSNVCQGGAVNLSASIISPSSYQWQFNGVVVSINSGYNITGATLADAGTYTVIAYYTAFNGNVTCPSTNTTQVNVVGTSAVLASASPGTIVCQGTNLILNASNASAPAASSFAWQGPSFTSSVSSPVIQNAAAVNSGNYVVTAYFSSPFLTCSTTNTIHVTVVPVSVPIVSLVANVCQGVTNIVASATAAGATDYLWTGPASAVPNGSLSAPLGNFQFTTAMQPNFSGIYYVQAYFGPSHLCSTTSSAQLNVVPVNTVAVISPGSVCSPNNAFLQSYSPGANSYSWAGPNGYTTPGANVWVYNPNSAATGIYTVTAYFGGGNITCSNTATLSLTVNTPMTFSLDPWHRVCYNTGLVLVGPVGASSYTWTSSTGLVSSGKDLVFPAVQPSDAGTYTLSITSGGCVTTNSTQVTVVSMINFSLIPSDRTVCSGDTIVLEAGVFGGSDNYAYSWSPALYLDGVTGPKHTAVPLGTINYNLIVHDIACPTFSVSRMIMVNVNQPPKPKFNLAKEAGCAPLSIKFESGLKADSALVTYDFGKGDEGVIQGINASATWLNPGTYNVKVYTVDRKTYCSGVFSYPNPIVVYDNPGSSVKWSPEKPTTIDEVTFLPSWKYKNIVDYHWELIGGVIPNDTGKVPNPDTTRVLSPVRLYPQFGKYPLMLVSTTDMGCSDTVGVILDIMDGLQVFIPNTFTPNDDGINDVFMVKGIGMKPEGFSMDIFDRAGRNIFTTKNIDEPWDGKVGGQVVRDATYTYKVKVVGMNGEGRKEYIGHVNVLK